MSPRDDLIINYTQLNMESDNYGTRSLNTLVKTKNNNAKDSEVYNNGNNEGMDINGISHDKVKEWSGATRFSSRLWNIKKNTIVNIYPSGADTKYSISLFLNGAEESDTTHQGKLRLNEVPKYTYAVSADFRGYGVEQLLYIGSDSQSKWKSYLIEAQDVNEPDQGVSIQQLEVDNLELIRFGTPVVADFDTDGNKEIAYLAKDGIALLTICSNASPDEQLDTICEDHQALDAVSSTHHESSGTF